MTNLKNQLLFVALMAIGSYTMTTNSAQNTPTVTTHAIESLGNQSATSTVFAPKAKTTLPF